MGRIGNGRGAGPESTAADFLGSYSVAWQKQWSSCFSLSHPVTGHCACLQIAEYATMPSAAYCRVLSSSELGSSLRTRISFRRDPLRTTPEAGSMGQAMI